MYRFISNQLVVAYDDRQMLSLNSCNIVIPKIEGMQIKYILAILNSSVSQFVYQKEFHSIKVLRAHMEHIPIPRVGKAIQNEIIAMTEPLIHGMGKRKQRLARNGWIAESWICSGYPRRNSGSSGMLYIKL